ncbi:MAG: type II toxin-antitoxin system PemK/MazF family toxin [Chlorobiaceae bacterium]|nr:type II toxin-antitoxin system PemK/MazF family toxin [Chlorobiaceae bacterium]
MSYEQYDIVVVPFPFTEKKMAKHRPAVIISSHLFNVSHDHITLAMITSSQISSWISDAEIRDWKIAQLMVPCKIRFKLFTLPKDLIVRQLGNLSQHDRGVLNESIRKYLIPA